MKGAISTKEALYFASENIVCSIKQIAKLYKLPIAELRKMNDNNYPAYAGKELTKEQLIYQLVFLADAPEVTK